MMFTGSIDAKSDSKGRVFLPARFRRVLHEADQSELVLARSAFEPCIVVYTRQAWDERLAELRARVSKWDGDQMRLMRQFVADALVVELDGIGRILLPRRFMEYADIKSEVTFVGMDDTIEIWSRGRMEQQFLSAEDLRSGLSALMSGGSGERGDGHA